MTTSEQLPDLRRLRHSLLPTPFHRLDALSKYLGVSVWCKRDDLTGFGFGGNKTRKLDFLIAEALSSDATDVIATGGVQSNFCRMAAAYAAHEHLACHLVLGEADAEHARSGNLTLDALFGAKIHLVASDDWNDWEEEASLLAQHLRNDDRLPYRMPIGGSTPIGAMGYVHGMVELLEDVTRSGLSVDAVVHASSSGGTQAGLIVGAALMGWEGGIRGIGVAKNGRTLAVEVAELARRTSVVAGTEFDPAAVLVDDQWVGEGYAIPSREGREAQNLFARLEGIVLDDVYTSKAAAGLIGMCRDGLYGPGDTLVFLHTGGSPQIFAEKRSVRNPDLL